MKIQYKFLLIDEKSVMLLNREIKFSATEHKFLLHIAKGEPTDIDSMLLLLPPGVKRGSVSVYINSINRKAMAITGRKLVLFNSRRYILNPYM